MLTPKLSRTKASQPSRRSSTNRRESASPVLALILCGSPSIAKIMRTAALGARSPPKLHDLERVAPS
jgi:hypothetical protein